VLPIVLIYGTGDILAKLHVSTDGLLPQLVVFLCVMNMTGFGVSLLLLPLRPKHDQPLLNRPLAKAGVRAALGSNVNQLCFFVSMLLAPNPAYPSMILLLIPVWLLVYHRLAKIPDDASPVAGTMMVVAAIVLMVLVS
jgi:hypothetical protein